MKRILAWALAGLLSMSFQAGAHTGGLVAKDCAPGRGSGAEACRRLPRVRVELPASPAPGVGELRERPVSAAPARRACPEGARGGYTISSDGRISDAGC